MIYVDWLAAGVLLTEAGMVLVVFPRVGIKFENSPSQRVARSEAESKEKTWSMGPCGGVDYNLTLCPLQSRLQHTYHEQPYARVNLNSMPESTLFSSQGLLI
jgi:hypothetical protein